MKVSSILPLFSLVLLVGCGSPEAETDLSEAPEKTDPQETAPTVSAPKDSPPIVAINVNAADAAAMLKETPELVVLDVRTPEEYAEGHIAGATNIDFKAPDFEENLSAFDREASYIVHCRSGARSGQSMAIFEKLKFENIIHLNTGFNGWMEAGLPVEK